MDDATDELLDLHDLRPAGGSIALILLVMMAMLGLVVAGVLAWT